MWFLVQREYTLNRPLEAISVILTRQQFLLDRPRPRRGVLCARPTLGVLPFLEDSSDDARYTCEESGDCGPCPRNAKRPGIPIPGRHSQISALCSLTPRQNCNRFEFLQRSGLGEFLLGV
jgi:hypothetical protein